MSDEGVYVVKLGLEYLSVGAGSWPITDQQKLARRFTREGAAEFAVLQWGARVVRLVPKETA